MYKVAKHSGRKREFLYRQKSFRPSRNDAVPELLKLEFEANAA